MDAILALCHFCESHGPCVILSTQRSREEPIQNSHCLNVPWCEACQSINLDQALISRDGKTLYVTTRTPQQQDLSFLLKQAAVRSLSCEEETSKDGGTLYFGDSKRGHVVSHSFTLRDSLARGFYRKYSVLVFMKDKVHLLNSWPILVHNIQELVKELKNQADVVNGVEQAQRPQRAVREAQGCPKSTARSLSQLTCQPAIFGHIHLWFTWILGYQTVIEKPNIGLPLPQTNFSIALRNFANQWDDTTLKTISFCVITGYQIVTDDAEVTKALKVLLPQNWVPLPNADICHLKKDNNWRINWSGTLPTRLPSLQITIEKALRNKNLPNSALETFISSTVLKWLHIAQSLNWSKGSRNRKVLCALGVQNHDMPVINYWTFKLLQN